MAMRALSSMELLQAWEQGIEASGVDRALILLGAACRDSPDEDPAQFSVGERDARLLTLREWTFGPEVLAVTHCRKCADVLELNFRVDDVRAEAPAHATVVLALADGDYNVKFRLPNSLDLREVQGTDDSPEGLAEKLFRRCLLEVSCGGENVAIEQLPEATTSAVAERMREVDAQAEIELALECSQCHCTWSEMFDIASFFWTEIQAWASRTLNEIHQLASAYGWSETQILGLSSLRRNLYLNLIAG